MTHTGAIRNDCYLERMFRRWNNSSFMGKSWAQINCQWFRLYVERLIVLQAQSILLPLIGMVSYGFAAFLALKLAAKVLSFRINERNGGLDLLCATTSMATASPYFCTF
ncbi:hypothetical protein L1987_16271 [Smallanthus sonchifolius]|uniref:Uncharacterized protein n=1 Tax=Smallanthus sonchifolius TaxID=185202 RepID=A0ACB9J8C9_9ASTR|nr:hypothetical protein L1987_16271 [Smallanthus sonchifolius]